MAEKRNISKYEYGACDVNRAYKFYFNYLLSKLDEIFIWKGKVFERQEGKEPVVDTTFMNHCLFLHGKVCLSDFADNTMRAYFGNLGGEQTGYYMPSQYIVANPIWGSESINITDKDRNGVMCYNTKTDKPYMLYPFGGQGLFNLIKQTATMLADNMVSINVAQINTRANVIFTAETPALATSAEQQLKRMYEGHPYTIVKENMINKLGINPVATQGVDITELTELQQYIIAHFFNSIGIKSNAINKKERLITDEINYIDDYLAISLESMLSSRQEFVDAFNDFYGEEYGEISVELNDILKPVMDQAKNPEEYMALSNNTNEPLDDTAVEGEGNGTEINAVEGTDGSTGRTDGDSVQTVGDSEESTGNTEVPADNDSTSAESIGTAIGEAIVETVEEILSDEKDDESEDDES